MSDSQLNRYFLVNVSSDEDSPRIAITKARHSYHAEEKFREAGLINDGESLEDMQLEIWGTDIIEVE